MILSWSNLFPDENLPSQGRKRAYKPQIIYFKTIWHNIKVVRDIVLLLMPQSLASHRPPLMLPMLVDCCFLPLLQMGGVWGHHFLLLFSGLILSNVTGAAELLPPQRLSLRLLMAIFGHHLRQVHVQLGQCAGGGGGPLKLATFPLGRKMRLDCNT